jgi:hypothetical protein
VCALLASPRRYVTVFTRPSRCRYSRPGGARSPSTTRAGHPVLPVSTRSGAAGSPGHGKSEHGRHRGAGQSLSRAGPLAGCKRRSWSCRTGSGGLTDGAVLSKDEEDRIRCEPQCLESRAGCFSRAEGRESVYARPSVGQQGRLSLHQKAVLAMHQDPAARPESQPSCAGNWHLTDGRNRRAIPRAPRP